ncbi:PucR family transcriptional regulator ligand-binding domain-containing protein [Dermatophilaceae bacterium Soc4.6]
MPVLTVAAALAIPVIRAAGPVVLAGKAQLGRRIRWVHATELDDIGPLLRAGDLVLSTGVGLQDDERALTDFAASLAEADAAGLMIELGRRWRTRLPQRLVSACEELSLPLVALRHESRFAAITQAVGERIVDEQLTLLRDVERVHETFTELSFTQAGPREVLETVQRLGGAAVVLENDQGRVLDYVAGPGDLSGFLDDWPSRSARVRSPNRTSWDEANGWLVTRLGPPGRSWGRLVIEAPAPATPPLVAVAERAAAALAQHRLHARDRDNLTRRTHHELLVALQSDPGSASLHQRCELAGFPVHRRRFVGLVVRARTVQEATSAAGRSASEELVAAVVSGASQQRVPALVAETDHDVRVLLSVSVGASEATVVDGLAGHLARQHEVVIGVGRTAPTRDDIPRTLLEAQQVVDAVPEGAPTHPVHRLDDVHLRGLLTLFGDDDRLRLFVDRELDPLRAHDAEHGTDLLDVLRALLRHPTAKSAAADSLHLSRPAFYARLRRVEEVLGLRLDDADLRTSLHVALIADELARRRPP